MHIQFIKRIMVILKTANKINTITEMIIRTLTG